MRRAGGILAAAALSIGAAVAAAEGGAEGGGPWDPHGVPARIPGSAGSAGLTEAGRASMGPCELEGAERSTTSSMRCIACHDGTAGPAVAFQMAPDGRGMSHPVEVDYGAAVARQPDRYHPAATLPPEVPLVNGRITCTTCHDGASPDPKHVAIPRRLCESCHAL